MSIGMGTARKSLFVTLGSVSNVLVGLAFQLLLAANLGVSASVDVFTLGTMAPTLIATVLTGSAPSVLVPAFARLIESSRDGRISLWPVLVPTAVIVALSAAIAGIMVPLASMIGRTLQPSDVESLALFFMITALAIPLSWVAGVAQSVLLVQERFLIVGFAGAINGVGLLGVSLIAFAGDLAISSLAWAFVAGYVLQVVIEAGAAVRYISWRPTVQTSGLLPSIALLLGSALIYKSQPIIERLLATYVVGGPAVLNYAGKISQALLMASTLGLALVSLPAISRLVARGDVWRGYSVASRMTLAIAAFSAPLVTAAVVAPSEIVTILFGRGQFDSSDVLLVSTVLVVSATGVLFSALTGPMVNLLYATSRYRLVAFVAVATTLLGGIVSWILRLPYGLVGIAAGTALMFVVNFAFFWFVAARTARSSAWGHLARTTTIVLTVFLGGLLINSVPVFGAFPHPAAAWVKLGAIGVVTSVISILVYVLVRPKSDVPAASKGKSDIGSVGSP